MVAKRKGETREAQWPCNFPKALTKKEIERIKDIGWDEAHVELCVEEEERNRQEKTCVMDDVRGSLSHAELLGKDCLCFWRCYLSPGRDFSG